MPDRRRIGFSEPYTPEQYEELRATFVRVAKNGDGEVLFEKPWLKLQHRALCCHQQRNIILDRRAVTGGRRSGETGQKVARAPVGVESDAGKGSPEAGVAGGHTDVAGQRQTQAGTGRHAVDRRDGG